MQRSFWRLQVIGHMWKMENRLSIVTLAALWMAALTFSGCASTDPVVKIGLVGPFEGRHRAVGYDVIYSARLAVREVNSAGGIGGYRVALVALDDGGDSKLALGAASSLVIDQEVVAVVGHWLNATTASAAPVYARAGLPFIRTGISPFDQSDPTTLPSDFLEAYRTVSPFDEEAGPYAGPAYDAFQLLWLVLSDATEAGRSIERVTVASALARRAPENVPATASLP